jgi:glyoxylase-like metal-dependent hydrolase (beta-lactamase superfamily II)
MRASSVHSDHLVTIGNVSISRVREFSHLRPADLFFPGHAEDIGAVLESDRAWLAPYVSPGAQLTLNFQAFVIRTGTRTILVDPCLGNRKVRKAIPSPAATPFLNDLDLAVGGLETIDTVLFTHLHADHIGWNTQLLGDRWTPTFPGARHLVVGEEWEYWKSESLRAPDTDFARAIEDSMVPLFADGLVDLVDGSHIVSEEVQLMPTPGHSPGHVALEVSSGSESGLITGDLIHHPIQVVRPGWLNQFDADPNQAAGVREEVIERMVSTGSIMVGTHFGGPAAGVVVEDGSGRSFRPIAVGADQ